MREIPSFVYDPSLVLYLPFRKRDGTSFISDDAYGHLATVTGATWGIRGRSFDGTDDTITIPDANSLDITGGISLFAWVNLDQINAQRTLIWKGGADTNPVNYAMFINGAGKIAFQFYNGDWRNITDTAFTLSATTWYMVGATADGSNIRFYMNGVAGDSPSQPAALLADTNQVRISGTGHATSYFMDGLIGEVWIYTRVLSAGEIQCIYQATNWRY